MKGTYVEGIIHVHSSYSYDGKISLTDLKGECVKRNIRFVLLTEHSRGFDDSKVRALVEECAQLSSEAFLIVPGLEFSLDSHNDLHLLAIGLQSLPRDNSLEAIVRETRKDGGLLIVAHPVRNSYVLPDSVAGVIDGIEIWNAAYNSRYSPDVRAIRLLQNLNVGRARSRLIGFSGLDLHDRSGLKGLRMGIFSDYEDAAGLLMLIRNSGFTNRGAYLALSSRSDLGSIPLALLALLGVGLSAADSLRWKLKSLNRSNKKE